MQYPLYSRDGRTIYLAEIPDNTPHDERCKRALEQAVAHDANLVGVDLTDARLYGARLDGARLASASLVRASLVRASLVRASLASARLVRARLASASLDYALLDYARLYGARLDGARLDYASLYGANLGGTDLRFANLHRAFLVRSGVRTFQGHYTIIVCANRETGQVAIQIGCQQLTERQWRAMDERRADCLDGQCAVDFLRTDGPVVDALIAAARRDVGWLPDGSGRLDDQHAA